MTPPVWSTACKDWESRIENKQSLIPFPPLFPEEAEAGLSVMKLLKLVDVAGSPTVGECCAPWVFDFASSIFGSYDAETGKRLIKEYFLLIAKKNSKALSLSTPIPTPEGWKRMGDLEAGDQVFGIDGQPCNVISTSEVFVDHDCYELEFSNGEKVIADAGHQWNTNALADRPGSGQGNHGRKANIRNRVRTTEEIANTLLRPSDGARNHSMPMPSPLMCTEKNLPIGPYTLGAWLGDGHSKAGKITTMDLEILSEIEKEGYSVEFKNNNGSRASTYAIGLRDGRTCRRGHSRDEHAILEDNGKYRCRLCARERGKELREGNEKYRPWTVFSLYEVMQKNNLIDNKHIPEIYLRASYNQRLSLLQGLMDTDGTVNKNGRVFSYTTVKERLAIGVCDLLSTFGIKHSLTEREMTCNGKRLVGRTCWVIQFSVFRDEVPCFKLSRKLDRMRFSNPEKVARSRNVHFTQATKIPSVPVKCITVDSKDSQFLFGRTMLPTHNSTIGSILMLTVLIRNWRQAAEFLILSPTIEVANNSYAPAKDAIKHDEELSDLFQVQDHLRTITHRKTGATLKVVAADSNTVGGKKAAGILIDELWLFGKNPNAMNMLVEATGGLASRPEGFVIYLTTQSDQAPAGVFKDKLKYARDVRDGVEEDNAFLPVLYEFPKHIIDNKENRNPKNFYMTNPNMGYSVSEEFLIRELKKAEHTGEAAMLSFLSKHTNLEIGMALRSDRWAGADFWAACEDERIDLDYIIEKSEVISIGVDGGGLDDLLALVVIGRCKTTKKWLLWSKAWAHPSVLERRKSELTVFEDFERQGDLIFVRSMGEDIEQLVDIIDQVNSSGLLYKVGLDPAGIGAILEALEEIDVSQDNDKVVGISQGWKLGGSIKSTERKLAEKALLHAKQPLADWCVSNCKVEPRANSILITKQASGSAKIDVAMAMFNAVFLMSQNPADASGKFQMFFVG